MFRRLERLPQGFVEGLLRGAITRISEKTGGTRSADELQRELQELPNFTDFAHSLIKRGVLRAEDLNRSTENLYLALSAIYRALIVSGHWQTQQFQLLQGDTAQAEQILHRSLQDIRAFKLLKLDSSWNDIRIVSFADTRNLSTSGTALRVDPRTRSLSLLELSRSRIQERRGTLQPVSEVQYLTDGITGFSRQDHGTEKAIDSSEETFWAETVYADDRLESKYSGTTYQGLGLLYVLDLRQTELLNRIDLKPFGERPPRLLALSTSVDGKTYTNVPGFSEPSRRRIWWSFSFDLTPCRFVRAVLLQDNYTEHVFHLPNRILQNQLLFDHLAEQYVRFQIGAREDSEIETRESISSEKFGLLLDALGRLEKEIAKNPLPGDASAGILDLERLTGALFSATRITDNSLKPLTVGSDPGDQLVEARKYEYTTGLFHLEASRIEYHPRGEFVSPQFKPSGTLWEAKVSASPTKVTRLDDAGNDFPLTTTEFDIEISPTRIAPIVPYGTSRLEEVVKIDSRSRSGRVRFRTTDGAARLWRNGKLLYSGVDYVFTPSTRIIEIYHEAFRLGSTYTISYIPTSGQDVLDVLGSYTPFENRPLDTFRGSDKNGLVQLTKTPFVDYGKINNRSLFYKEESNSRFHFRSGLPQETIGGEVWGIAATTLSSGASSTDTVLNVFSSNDFASSGEVTVGTERIKYTSKSPQKLEGCTRGHNGTTPQVHAINDDVVSQGNTVYDPIVVLVNGTRALNRTDYLKGEHAPLPASTQNAVEHSFIQAGSRIYFGSQIPQARVIEVQYKVLSEYVSLRTRFYQTVPGQRFYTPTLDEALIYMNAAEV